ncbi:MAG: APC family permease [Polyangiales bacterium]
MFSLRRALFGAPKDVRDPHAMHKLSLVAFLAWVGLGADGLSSSAYGPDESFRALGEHTGMAFFLALATAATVFIISYGYTRIVEQFPTGGGGYVVASRLLGPKTGVVSGSALLVDYVLTISISIASGADAIFSFLPQHLHVWKLPVIFSGLAVLTLLNLRGVKESVTALVPIFLVFVVTHVVLLVVAIGGRAGQIGATATEVHSSISKTTASLGVFGALHLFVRAYSLGGGTYTGIEAVSNGVAMMREPKVRTAKRTMVLMATSLAITAGGIMLSYLLLRATPVEGKTMNAVLLERLAGAWQIGELKVGMAFVIVTLVSEGALLFVAAQAGFLDGPRVMASMAVDSWFPHRFAALSERLSMQNGVVLMAAAATGALIYTRGDVSKLVVMYSINVFVTFSLSNLGMVRFWVKHRAEHEGWARHLFAHVLALLLCVTILCITVFEKFREGGWVTLLVTSVVVMICFSIRRHYKDVVGKIVDLDKALPSPEEVEREKHAVEATSDQPFDRHEPEEFAIHRGATFDREKPVAILFVGGYGGLGRHALMTLLRMFPAHFSGVVFASIAVVDSETFKGHDQMLAMEKRTRAQLLQYELFARTLGLEAMSAYSIGTEVAVEAEKIATSLQRELPKALTVAGQLLFAEDSVWNRVLHNETAFLIQNRLQHVGVPMVVIPVRLGVTSRWPAPRAALSSSAQ